MCTYTHSMSFLLSLLQERTSSHPRSSMTNAPISPLSMRVSTKTPNTLALTHDQKRERERNKPNLGSGQGLNYYPPGYRSEKVMNFAVACFYFSFLACGKTRKLDYSGSFQNTRLVHADLAAVEGLCLRSFLTASE